MSKLKSEKSSSHHSTTTEYRYRSQQYHVDVVLPLKTKALIILSLSSWDFHFFGREVGHFWENLQDPYYNRIVMNGSASTNFTKKITAIWYNARTHVHAYLTSFSVGCEVDKQFLPSNLHTAILELFFGCFKSVKLHKSTP